MIRMYHESFIHKMIHEPATKFQYESKDLRTLSKVPI